MGGIEKSAWEREVDDIQQDFGKIHGKNSILGLINQKDGD
jgi:hypothetical protein